MELLTAVSIGLLFATGIFQLLRRNVIRSAMGLMILANGVNLFLLTTGAYDGTSAAYTTEAGVHSDALPQALILTAIVISMGGTAFVLSMLYIISARYQTADMDEVDNLKH
ncbi:MAG: NADH-quinone oxidoreductase subunit K [Anaerolineae bacterium]|nr:NADH-quinone oxidoreductase subunit K [Anaerolineae bacterium]